MALEHMSAWAAFKNLSYVVTFLYAVEWLGFHPLTLNVFIILMILDVFTGIVRSCVLGGCQSIKSSVGIHGVLSKILLLIALFSIALVGKSIGFDVAEFVQGAVVVLMMGELYSILGNIHSARTGTAKVEFDAVAYLLSQVRNTLAKFIPTK